MKYVNFLILLFLAFSCSKENENSEDIILSHSDITLKIGEEIIIEVNNSANYSMDYNDDIIEVKKIGNNIKLRGRNKGVTTLRISNATKRAFCKISVSSIDEDLNDAFFNNDELRVETSDYSFSSIVPGILYIHENSNNIITHRFINIDTFEAFNLSYNKVSNTLSNARLNLLGEESKCEISILKENENRIWLKAVTDKNKVLLCVIEK